MENQGIILSLTQNFYHLLLTSYICTCMSSFAFILLRNLETHFFPWIQKAIWNVCKCTSTCIITFCAVKSFSRIKRTSQSNWRALRKLLDVLGMASAYGKPKNWRSVDHKKFVIMYDSNLHSFVVEKNISHRNKRHFDRKSRTRFWLAIICENAQ